MTTTALATLDKPGAERTKDGGWRDRIRLGLGKRPYVTIHGVKPGDVEDRFARLRTMAKSLVDSGKAKEAPRIIADAAKLAADRKALAGAERWVRELCAKQGGVVRPLMMRELCDLYTSGELKRRFPRDVDKRGKTDATREHERRRLALLCNAPVDKGRTLGDTLVADVTKADCDRAMLAVPDKSDTWRRSHAQPLQHLLDIACLQMELIGINPLPRGWAGSPSAPTLTAILYPKEEARLAACPDVLIDDRVMWGVQAREAFRPGGIGGMRREDLDLDAGTVSHMHKTKTWRTWALEPDVLAVLRWWLDFRPDPEFVFPHVARGTWMDMAARFRDALLVAGVDRKALHVTPGKGRRPIRAHDLRTTFVTVAFAAGWSEGRISQKTGHTTSAQLSRYKRVAESLEALNLGWFAPLDGLLGVGQRVAQKLEIPEETSPNTRTACSSSGASRRAPVSKTPVKSTAPRLSAPQDVVQAGGGGLKPGPGPDDDGGTRAGVPGLPVDVLEELHGLATKARRWDLAQAVAVQLDALDRASDAGKVTSLDRARRKKGGR